MTTPATIERRRFADELLAAGPDAPTLCEGWTTRDLAAHVVLRETRPDAAVGVVAPFLSGYTDKVQQRIARDDYDELVESVRTGPPAWSPTRIERIDRAVNTAEFFVHLEDVRRGGDDWSPRALDTSLQADIHASLSRVAKLLTRRSPVGVVLEPDDGHAPIVAKRGEPTVHVRGGVGELMLFVYGRADQAAVELDGTDDAVARLRSASFGF
ncbi:TIGR03085 family metal-binding protein [Ilumatobacter sp.]|uniref:TIGR03085 family metal-binding protein n=1 Tax=Ilumatobacter sp. TaxID=1967498 RepID=UPI003B517975